MIVKGTSTEAKKLLESLVAISPVLFQTIEETPEQPKEEPKPVEPKVENPKAYYLRAVRKGSKDSYGNEVIAVSICEKGTDTPISTLHCVSGQAYAQAFRLGVDSKSGSNEPLPQGDYSLGTVEFASGIVGDYSKNWNDGLGPVWIAITPKFTTERSALGLHLDANRTSAPGSAGCLTVTSLDDLKTLVAWFTQYKPVELVCDWGIATGLSVSDIQKELNEHFDAKLVVDGQLGPKTIAAIKEAEGYLKLVPNGVPDADLFSGLLSLKGLIKDITPEVVVTGDTAHPDFLALWNTMVIRPEKMPEVQLMAAKITKNKARYEAVSKVTGVPWIVIGCIHKQESNCDFGAHLHNGDPLTARTVQVPAGRPIKGNPPFTWEESAIDALGYDGATGIKDWNIVATIAFLERYNGLGYRNKGIYSPYLFSYTNFYSAGKYTSDGNFSPTAVSQQCGCVPLLKVLNYC